MKRHEAAMLYGASAMVGFLVSLLEFHNLALASIMGGVPIAFFIGSEVYLKIKY